MSNRIKQSLLILGLIQCAVFIQVLGFPWMQLDDPKHIFENRAMLSPSLEGFFKFWTEPYFGMYIPLTYSVWFFTSLVSLNPSLFHGLNFLFHFASTCLVFFTIELILAKTSKGAKTVLSPALVGAILFGIHPLQAESVAWISGLKDCLSGFFFIGASYLYVRSIHEKNLTKFSMGAFILSLLCKPTTVIFPLFAVGLRQFLVKERIAVSIKNTRLFFIPVLPFLILTKILQPDSQVQDLAPIWFRPIIAIDSLGFYMRQIFAPFWLSLDYGRSPKFLREHLETVSLTLPFLLLSIFLFTKTKKEWRPLYFLLLIPLLPVLGLVPFQFQLFSSVCDRYMYLSIFALSLGASFLLSQLNQKQAYSIAAGALLIFAMTAFIQTGYWRSDEAIFGRTLEINPRSFLAHNNLGFAYYTQGKFQLASKHFAQTVLLRPQVADLYLNYGASLAKIGRSEEAIEQFKRATELAPDNQAARSALNQMLLERRKQTH